MAMKKAELDKQLGLKIAQRKGPEVAGRFGQNAAGGVDRREQRRVDAAAGLVPFACKLPKELTVRLAERAADIEGGINALVASLLERGLEGQLEGGPDKTKK